MNPNNNQRPPASRATLPPGKFAPRPKPAAEPSDQDRFLDQIRRDKTLVQVVLTTGAAVSGRIGSHDRYTVTLQAPAGNSAMLIFKSALVSIAPKAPTPAAGATA